MSRRQEHLPERDQLELFRALPGDLAPRDAQDLMAYPFFSLAKTHRTTPIDYRVNDVAIRVEAVPEHGMATIWDADVLIWAASQIVEARDAGVRTSRLYAGTSSRLATASKDRRMTRSGWIVVAAIVVCGASTSAVFRPAPKVIWNASASVPIGLYLVHPAGPLRIGELLVVAPPEPLATFLDVRHYLPKGVPLLKHVAALPGQTVCRTGGTITVDGIAVGVALGRDHLGRPLPTWQGCRVIAGGEVFLMNRRAAASLDGRYFGPLPTTTIVGRADPIWTKTEPKP